MIGLVDFDLQTSTSTSLLIPNLEIMKLATYYKKEENTFCRLIGLNESDFSAYDKIYFFSESEQPINIPEQFLRANNVIYGGTAFTNDYLPFKNELIDFTLAKPTIYHDFLKQKYQDGVKAKTISHILDDSYYRMYAGNNKLPVPSIHPLKRVFLYDKNFFYPDWKETIDEISGRKVAQIIRIHPIICKTVTQFLEARNCNKLARSNSYILDFDIPLDEVNYMLKKYKKYFLAEISESSNIFVALGGSFNAEAKYYKDFIYKINLLYAFWANEINLKICYKTPLIGENDPLKNLSKLVETWTIGKTKNVKTLMEKMPKGTKKNIPREKQEYEELIKLFPNAKNLFNQTCSSLKNRRYWKT